jgi:SAM-dependent methyltransferase
VKTTWDTLAKVDPMWAALMDPEKAGRRWDQSDFFEAGKQEIEVVLSHVSGLGVNVDPDGRALDFGCGIGRLTQALAPRFRASCGVDISPTMIELAQRANRYPETCTYLVNDADELGQLADGEFAFIYSSVVLQHMPRDISTRYIAEFGRLLAVNGVVVFQVPDRVEPGRTLREKALQLEYRARRWIGLRTRLRRGLRWLGLRRGAVGAGEVAAEMHCVSEADVRRALGRHGVDVIDVQLTNSTDLAFTGGLRYLERPPSVGYVSKQYTAVRQARSTG